MSILSKHYQQANDIVTEVEHIDSSKDTATSECREFATRENRDTLEGTFWNLNNEKNARYRASSRLFFFFASSALAYDVINFLSSEFDPQIRDNLIFSLPDNVVSIAILIGLGTAAFHFINAKRYERASGRVRKTLRKLYSNN